MIAVLSPAKSLNFEDQPKVVTTEQPRFQNRAGELIEILKSKSEDELKKLMNISNRLAELNVQRYNDWQKNPKNDRVQPAVFAFTGDVYQGLDARSLTKKQQDYTHNHVRILSGLYGVLRPLDMIQPYRLEMGTKLKTEKGKDLYEFWSNQITQALNEDAEKLNTEFLVNLASNEYFKSVKKKELNSEIITPAFKDYKNGKFKVISFYAKKARGLMARFMAEHNVQKPQDLLAFDYDGYSLNNHLTQKESEPVFTRGGQ